MNLVGEYKGFRLFSDTNCVKPKYISKFKDGNKLGKRKQNLMIPAIVFCDDYFIAHPKIIKELL